MSHDQNPLHVVAIEPSGRLFGSEACLLDVMEGTRPLGVRWQLIMPRGGGFDERVLARGFEVAGSIAAWMHRMPRWRRLMEYVRLRRVVRRLRPDLVYLNQAGLLRGVGAALRGLGLPIVCQVQTLEDARRLAAAGGGHPGVEAFICNSRFIAAAARLPEERCSVLYQGVPAPAAIGWPAPVEPGRPLRVGILGRIARSKGHFLLIEAARMLAARQPGAFQFVVIGNATDEETERAFGEALEAAGLRDVFELRGFREAVGEELARLHLLVIPSLEEPLGRVLIDACAAGLPAVVADSGGLGEFSRDLGAGVRFAAGDAASLACAIEDTAAAHDEAVTVFRRQAAGVFKALPLDRYAGIVHGLLVRAGRRQACSVRWFGGEVPSSPEASTG